MSDTRTVIVGLDEDGDPYIATDTEYLGWWNAGEGSFKVEVPAALVEDLERARDLARVAHTAILGHLRFDSSTGQLPLCASWTGDSYRGVPDECWTCGHPAGEHPES